MNTKKDNSNPETTPALPLARGRVTDFTEKWIGSSPKDLGLPEGNRDKIDLDVLVDKSITIYGYSLRKGDTGDFVICLFSQDGRTVQVFVSGAAVVVRKLLEVGAQKGFPIEAKVFKGASTKVKNSSYYDLR